MKLSVLSHVRSLARVNLPTASGAGRLLRLTDGSGGLVLEGERQWMAVGGERVDVRAYGGVGDGTTDNAPAIAASCAAAGRGGEVLFPSASAPYLVRSPIALGRANDYVKLIGGGGAAQAAPNSPSNHSVLQKGFAGSLITVGGVGIVLDTLTLDNNNRGGCTGPVVELLTPNGSLVGNSGFGMRHCKAFDLESYGLQFSGAGAGDNALVEHCAFQRVASGSPIAAIRFPTVNEESGAHGNRSFVGVHADGQWPLFEALGGSDAMLVGCVGAGAIFGVDSLKFAISGCRFALSGSDLTIQGTNHILVGNTINGGNVVLSVDSHGCVVGPNVMPGNYTVIDLAARGNNFAVNPFDLTHRALRTNGNSVVFGVNPLSQGATNGFVYLPTLSGPPTSAPQAEVGTAPIVIDPANGRVRVFLQGSWWSAPLTLGSGTLLQDSFDRGDASSLGTADTGGAWAYGCLGDTDTSALIGIASNRAYHSGGATPADGHAYLEGGQADVIADVTFNTQAPSGTYTVGLVLRRIDGSNYLAVRLGTGSSGNVAVTEVLAGVRTNTFYSAAISSGVDTLLRVSVLGGTLTFSVAEVQIGSQAVSNMTGTKHGIYLGSGAQSERLDGFVVRAA